MDLSVKDLKARVEGMKDERRNYEDKWRDIRDYIFPGSTAFIEDWNKNVDRDDDLILNSTPSDAHMILASGMQAGITSPSRPWFRLSVPDMTLAEYEPVKMWLKRTQDMMYMVYAKSNFYESTHSLFEQLSGPGVSAMGVFEDYDSVISCQSYNVGSFWIANDSRGRANTFARAFKLSTAQMVEKFGRDKVSTAVKNAYENGNYFNLWDVWYYVEPNTAQDKGALGWRGKPYRAVYWEDGCDKDKYLSVSGLYEFPVMCPRWSKGSNRPYGRSPAWRALPDAKMLMSLEEADLLGIENLTNPPLVAPSNSQDKIDRLPGGISYYDETGGSKGLRTLYENLSYPGAVLQNKIQVVEERIRKVFFNDLFLMISSMDKSGITAREISARESEKLIMLGPVFEGAKSELLDPCIDRTFAICLRNGLVGPPPEELQGMPLQVDYTSILAQAQKMVGLSAMNELVANVGTLVQMGKTDVLDKFDADQYVDEAANMLGISPGIVVSAENVAQIREMRAKQMAQQQAIEQGSEMADAAKTAADTPVGESNALEALMDMAGGQV